MSYLSLLSLLVSLKGGLKSSYLEEGKFIFNTLKSDGSLIVCKSYFCD
jgi:hypothetical protein